jgi:NADH:ubiquinone oxidoreductase subunit F (NADH-binding)
MSSSWLEGHPGLPRLLAGLDPGGGAMSLSEHQRIHGELPRVHPGGLIDAVDRSGLRGRGGADFPTSHKLRAVAGGRGASAVVVNGSETEPASAKDRLLLTRLPHLVLDGAQLAARTVAASEVIVVAAEHGLRAVEAALAVRDQEPIPTRLITSPEGYVAGEESAVMHYLNRGTPLPTLIPPRPFQRGYRSRPTLIQNPETLAQLALVARFGSRWFRELGTPSDPGSVLVTISGAVRSPGVYELAFGTPMTALLDAAGGPTEPLRALLVGGYFGTWVDARRALSLRLAREDLRASGCALGSGVLFALPGSACGLHETARVIDYLARQSAGQCGPCTYGLRSIAEGVAALAAGIAHREEADRIVRWISEVSGRGACHHPDGAVRFVASALTVFGPEINSHREGRCRARPAGLPVDGPTVRHPRGRADDHKTMAARR